MPASVRDEMSSTGSHNSSPATVSRASRKTTRRQRTARALIEGLHLHEAIIKSDISAVENILKSRVDVNAKFKGITPLMRASKRGELDSVRLLLAAKADINAQNKKQERAIHLAARAGHLEVLKALIHSGAELTVLNKRGQSFLFAAVLAGRVPVIRFVLEHLEHHDVTQQDGVGRSLLHVAAQHGHRDVAQLLIEAGCQVAATDLLGRTALHAACEENQSELCCLLLRQAATEPDAADHRGTTSLHVAVERQARPITELLLAKDVNPDAANQDGETPLHLAVRAGSAELVSLLLASGGDVTATSKMGNTALHLVASGDVMAISRTLISKGVDVQAQNKRGETALHVMAASGDEELCRLLLDHAASLDVREQCDRTPLYVAARGGFDTLVDIMICHSRSRKAQQDGISSKALLDDETHLKLLVLPPIMRVTWLNNNQSERVDELIRAVANRFLPAGKWKALARRWSFTEDQIEAIEHQFIGRDSYKRHGYRLLRLWHRSLGDEADPVRLLQDSLVSVDVEPSVDLCELSSNEEEMKKLASLKLSSKRSRPHCPDHCLCVIM